MSGINLQRTTPARRQVLTSPEPQDLWVDILTGMGPFFSLLARTPENVGFELRRPGHRVKAGASRRPWPRLHGLSN